MDVIGPERRPRYKNSIPLAAAFDPTQSPDDRSSAFETGHSTSPDDGAFAPKYVIQERDCSAREKSLIPFYSAHCRQLTHINDAKGSSMQLWPMDKSVTLIAAGRYRSKAAELRKHALTIDNDQTRANIEFVAKRWDEFAKKAEAEGLA